MVDELVNPKETALTSAEKLEKHKHQIFKFLCYILSIERI
jgi:2C-methyl-D-erythritol 2,4-cyclodiphosphate synthase